MGAPLQRLDRLFPKEFVVPLLLTFAAENVISAIFAATIPPRHAAVAWTAILIVPAAFVGHLTDTDAAA